LLVEVGRLIKAHGIKGELIVESLTDFPELRFANGAKLHTDTNQTFTVERCASHSGRLLIKLVEITDRTQAENLAKVVLFAEVAKDDLPPEKGKYFDRQLIGLLVAKLDGAVIGKVEDVVHLAKQDLLIVNSFGKEVLIPFVDEIVPEIDLEQGLIRINPPVGLLELSDEN